MTRDLALQNFDIVISRIEATGKETHAAINPVIVQRQPAAPFTDLQREFIATDLQFRLMAGGFGEGKGQRRTLLAVQRQPVISAMLFQRLPRAFLVIRQRRRGWPAQLLLPESFIARTLLQPGGMAHRLKQF